MIAAKRKIFSSFQHTLSTKCSRRSTIKHQRNCCSDAVMKEGAKNATPHALIGSEKWTSQKRLSLCKTVLEITVYHIGLISSEKSCY